MKKTTANRRQMLVGTGAVIAATVLSTASSTQALTSDNDEERKAVAVSYLKSLDNGGVSPDTGIGLFDHFADDCEVFFPKWGVAKGKDELIQLFSDVGGTLKSIKHDYDDFNWYMTGTEKFSVEGTSSGEHRDGPWATGRFSDCFEVSNGKIDRLFIYLDPDYAGNDTERYGWLKS